MCPHHNKKPEQQAEWITRCLIFGSLINLPVLVANVCECSVCFNLSIKPVSAISPESLTNRVTPKVVE